MSVGGRTDGIPEDPESDCLMAYAGPELDAVFALEITNTCFLYGGHTGIIKGFQLEEGDLACELVGHRGTVRQLLCPDPAGDTLFSCSVDGTIKMWNYSTSQEVRSFAGHHGGVGCLGTVGEDFLGSGGSDGTVRLWSLRGKSDVHDTSLKVHTGSVTDVAFTKPTETQAMSFSVSTDGLGKMVDLSVGKLIAVYEGRGPLHCCLLDEKDSLLYCGGSCKDVLLFDIRSAACVGQLRGHTEAVLGLAMFSPENEPQILYTAGDDCTVRHWNLETRQCEYSFVGHTAGVSSIKLTRNGVLYTSSYDESVRVWDREGAIQNIATRAMHEKEAQARQEAGAKGDKERKKKSSSKKGKDKTKGKGKAKKSKEKRKPKGKSGG